MKTIITFGTFDLLHVGHVRLLERALKLYDDSILIVGVSSDELNFKKKQRYPIYSLSDRIEIISALKCVNHTFVEESLEYKANYIKLYKADVLVMGNDWVGKFDYLREDMPNLEIVYLPRTESISTTYTIDKIVG